MFFSVVPVPLPYLVSIEADFCFLAYSETLFESPLDWVPVEFFHKLLDLRSFLSLSAPGHSSS